MDWEDIIAWLDLMCQAMMAVMWGFIILVLISSPLVFVGLTLIYLLHNFPTTVLSLSAIVVLARLFIKRWRRNKL